MNAIVYLNSTIWFEKYIKKALDTCLLQFYKYNRYTPETRTDINVSKLVVRIDVAELNIE